MSGLSWHAGGVHPRPAEARSRRIAAWVALLLGASSFLWFFPELDDVGLTWDEPHYFASADRIQDWTRQVVAGPDRSTPLSAEGIREAWDAYRYWNPHPPVYKEAMAVTEAVVGPRFGSLVGYRTAPLLFFSLLLIAVAWLAGRVWGITAGVGAGLALLGMPRLLGHAHIAATDIPLTLFWFVATAGFVSYARNGPTRHLWLGGIALGLAMGTKFTGWLVPAPLVAWLLLYGRRGRSWGGLIGWALVGLAVAFTLNPQAWHDPLGHVRQLVQESLDRETTVPIFTYYLGRVWEYTLPWHHAIVMTAVTLPVGILALFFVGGGRAAREGRRESFGVLCLLQVAFFWSLLALPGSPNHDGVRLFLPMFPFVAVLAGIGFSSLADSAGRLIEKRTAVGPARARAAGVLSSLLLGMLFFFPPYLQATRIAPYYLAYYGEAIGGTAGAARAGMEATYWLDAVTPAFLARLNDVVS